jgi:hypothetical protein
MEQALQRAIDIVSQPVWDTLPQTAKDALVANELRIMQVEKDASFKLEVATKRMNNAEHLEKHLWTIDEFTPKLKDLDVTRSRKMLANTVEYIQAVAPVLQQLKAGDVEPEQAWEAKENVMKGMQRQMDARRKRERKSKSKVIKKTVEQDVGKMAMKANDQQSISIDECMETVPIAYKDVAIIVPTRQEIERRLSAQRTACVSKCGGLDRLLHGNSFALSIVGKGVFHSWLPNMCTIYSDGTPHYVEEGNERRQRDWWQEFVVHVKDRLSRVVDSDNYEVEDRELSIGAIHMYYYIQRIESIEYWFESEVPPVMTFQDFELFTANDLTVPCEQQVAEHFQCVYDTSKTLKDMLAPRKVIYGHPGPKTMDQVKEYSDLVWDWHEDVATTDCDNIARIVSWNGHVGVVTSIKPKQQQAKTIRRLPIKASEDEAPLEVFVDIEAFASTDPGKYGIQVPYLIMWCTNQGDVVRQAEGPACVEKFVIWVTEQEDVEVVIYAWYGSGYDYQHIYKYFKDRCVDDTTYVRNNSIIYAKLEMPSGQIVHLKDPFLFILTSLDKAAKAFDVLNKGAFPHEIIKEWDDLDRVLDNWVIVRHSTNETVDGKTILVHATSWDEIVEHNNTKTVMQRAKEYCTIDVLAMKAVWTKFQQLVEKHLGIRIGIKVFTLSQLSMNMMKACLPTWARLHVPERDEYKFMSRAIYGGRVAAKNGVYEEPIIYADVVSLYPSAMRLLDHPNGDMARTHIIDWNKLGIYEVTLTSDQEPKDYMEFVPFRDDLGTLSYHWRPLWKGTYHTYDLMIAKEQGYTVECHRGFEWAPARLFDGFIDKLFKMKATNKGPIRMVAKIALNGGGYGKFVQKPIDTDLYVVRKGVVHGQFEQMQANGDGMIVKSRYTIPQPKFYNLDDKWDKMVIEDPDAEPHYATQVGISILSGSRWRLYKLCKQFPSMQVIYSDTDSVYVRKSSFTVEEYERFKNSCGTEIGQLDDTIGSTPHGVIDRMYVAGPKMYAYEYHDDNGITHQTVHCKGVRNKDLRIQHFEHLCKGVDYKIKYNMMIMAKNIVSVRSKNIDKMIEQTGRNKY